MFVLDSRSPTGTFGQLQRMCLFSTSVARVNNTEIFVAKLAGSRIGKQLTVYKNRVTLGVDPTAMILPVPNPDGFVDQISVIDMTACASIFEDLASFFPVAKSLSFGAFGAAANSQSAKLEIKQSGDYEYSIADTLNDLDMLDWSHFKVDEAIKTILQKQYAVDFGFVVCRCKKSGDYAPIGIVHPSIKGKLHVPTMHEHGMSDPSAPPEWDHTIYAVNTVSPQVDYLKTSLGQIVMTTRRRALFDAARLKLPKLSKGFGIFTSNTIRIETDQYAQDSILQLVIHGQQGNGDLLLLDSHLPEGELECCSAELMDHHHVYQESFACLTCAPHAKTLDLDLCTYCAKKHHANGHRVEPYRKQILTCDGYGETSLQNVQV